MSYATLKAERIAHKTALLCELVRKSYENLDSIPIELIDRLHDSLRAVESKLDAILEEEIINPLATPSVYHAHTAKVKGQYDALCDTLYVAGHDYDEIPQPPKS